MLYEAEIRPSFAAEFTDLRGVMLQSKRGDGGFSKHPEFRELQEKARLTIYDRISHEPHTIDPEPPCVAGRPYENAPTGDLIAELRARGVALGGAAA
jgi:hypothetical protein